MAFTPFFAIGLVLALYLMIDPIMSYVGTKSPSMALQEAARMLKTLLIAFIFIYMALSHKDLVREREAAANTPEPVATAPVGVRQIKSDSQGNCSVTTVDSVVSVARCEHGTIISIK